MNIKGTAVSLFNNTKSVVKKRLPDQSANMQALLVRAGYAPTESARQALKAAGYQVGFVGSHPGSFGSSPFSILTPDGKSLMNARKGEGIVSGARKVIGNHYRSSGDTPSDTDSGHDSSMSYTV